jgi:hypothetical protein
MTNPFLATFDNESFADFKGADMADMGSYTAPGWTAFDRRIYFDSGVQSLGDYNQVSSPRTLIGFLLVDGPVVKDARVVVDGCSYVLQQIAADDKNDGSLQWWVVRNG